MQQKKIVRGQLYAILFALFSFMTLHKLQALDRLALDDFLEEAVVEAKGLDYDFSRYKFRFLTNDLTYVDGRPVFSPDGKKILFMRQPNNGDPGAVSALYIVDVNGKKDAQLFFDGNVPNTNQPFNATRPDYSWKRKNYQIAFDALGDGIWILDVKTRKVKQVLEQTIDSVTYTWSYPAWYPDGEHLAVTNYNQFAQPPYHQLAKASIHHLNRFSVLTDNQTVWPGMSSVNQKKPSWICYAGQTPVPQPPGSCTCPTGGCTADGYAQNCNQIWLQKGSTTAPIDNAQGRAPWFSPNGKYIVFESNRGNPDHLDIYRLYVYSIKHKTVHVITPPSLNVQHGKWSPDGEKITFAVNLFGGAQGIAVVDLEP